MKLHQIIKVHEEPYFRKMRVESGFMYNFYDTEKDDYQQEWIFVPALNINTVSNGALIDYIYNTKQRPQ